MAGGHRVDSRDEVPVRRSVYDNGTVSYDFEHEGHRVFVKFMAGGRMRLVLHDQRLEISDPPHTMSGVTPKGRPFTNVGLEPASV
jgi:hypothetical protein